MVLLCRLYDNKVYFGLYETKTVPDGGGMVLHEYNVFPKLPCEHLMRHKLLNSCDVHNRLPYLPLQAHRHASEWGKHDTTRV